MAKPKDVNPAWFIFGWLFAAIGGYGLYLFQLRDITSPRYEYYHSITELFQPNWFIGSALATGIGALLFGVWVGKRFTRAVGGVVVVLTVGGVAALGAVQLMGYETHLTAEQAHSDMLTELGEVCTSENGNDRATSFQETPGIHPTLMFNVRSSGIAWAWDDDQPSEWMPESVENVELVACVFRHTDTVETCIYEGDTTLTRYHRWVEISVFTARDRQLLTYHRIDGDMPRQCQGFERFSVGGSTESIYGGDPTDLQVVDYVRLFAQPSRF